MKAEKYYNHGKYLENLCSGLKPPYNEILVEAFYSMRSRDKTKKQQRSNW